MAFSMVISSALPTTTKEQVEQVFLQLGFGDLERIDMVNAQARGKDVKKFFIHYSTTSTIGIGLRAGLDDRDARQKEGEIVEPIKIYYNRTRDGRDQYWQIYKTKTPAERLAEQAAKPPPTFTPRIEM